MSDRLTKDFGLEELASSPTARARGIDNTPPAGVRGNLAALARDILQPVRDAYGHPIVVTSGYRCPQLNAAVRGSKTSQHMAGEAADIICHETPKAELFRVIERMVREGRLQVGQLIWEYGTRQEPRWIHVSLPRRDGKPNNQILHLYDK